MGTQDSVRFTKYGVTIIEVMVALVIFSTIVGMVSHSISSVAKRPFVIENVEPWANLIQESEIKLFEALDAGELDLNSDLTNPFPELEKPECFHSWRIDWVDTSLASAKAAKFSAKTKQGERIEWILYVEKL